jgi:hypothetical protein
MDLRTTGSRDERRRRVLIDDAQAEPAHGDANPLVKRNRSDNATKGSRYSPDSLDQGQPRIADLLPKRRLTLWLWLLAAAVVIGALTSLDVASGGWSAQRPEVDWSAFRLDAPGSFARWVAALMLAWAGFAGLQIYLIRRHRADDYRGGYRLWSTAAVALMLASADAATSLHAFLGGLLGALFGASAHSTWIGLGLVLLAGVGLGTRMVWEIMPSRGSLAALSLAAMAYLTAVLSIAGLLDAVPVRPSLLGAAAALCGHALVLLTVGVFGRYVFLEAHGRLPQRIRKAKQTSPDDAPPKRRKSKTDPLDSGSESKKRGKSDVEGSAAANEKRAPEPSKKPEPKPAPAASSPPRIAGKTPAARDDDDEDDADADESPRLSKAERRKLRKQQLRKAA